METTLKDYLSLVVNNQFNTGSVFGQKDQQQLSRGDLLFIEYVLGKKPQFTNIVELGTASGLTSLYLGMTARLRSGKFITFDIKDHRMDAVKSAWLKENMIMVTTDILSQKSVFVAQQLMIWNTLAFIDNGDKAKEVNMYAPDLRKGSGFIVHDWGTEVMEEQIIDTLREQKFISMYTEVAQMLHCNCRYFQKLSE